MREVIPTPEAVPINVDFEFPKEYSQAQCDPLPTYRSDTQVTGETENAPQPDCSGWEEWSRVVDDKVQDLHLRLLTMSNDLGQVFQTQTQFREHMSNFISDAISDYKNEMHSEWSKYSFHFQEKFDLLSHGLRDQSIVLRAKLEQGLHTYACTLVSQIQAESERAQGELTHRANHWDTSIQTRISEVQSMIENMVRDQSRISTKTSETLSDTIVKAQGHQQQRLMTLEREISKLADYAKAIQTLEAKQKSCTSEVIHDVQASMAIHFKKFQEVINVLSTQVLSIQNAQSSIPSSSSSVLIQSQVAQILKDQEVFRKNISQFATQVN